MKRFDLLADRKGAAWDLLLYVPTVGALASFAAKLWYGEQRVLAYLLAFLASFFLIAGANRVLKTRLLLLPSAPVRLEVDAEGITVLARNGATTMLAKEQRLYGDLAGRSFGISGLNREGRRLQFVFHRGQFADAGAYAAAQEAIRRLGKTSARA